MGQISNIINGWKSYLKNENNSLAIERSKICEKCPEAMIGTYENFMPDETLKNVKGLKCNQCGCPLSAKLRSTKEKCPIGKWE